MAGDVEFSFALDGVARFSFGASGDVSSDLAAWDGGEIIALGTGEGAMSLAWLPPDGSLDPTFTLGGKLLVSAAAEGRSPALPMDGRLLAGGTGGPAGNRDFLMARINSDGTPNTTFGVNGIARIDAAGKNDFLAAISSTTDGRSIAGGSGLVGQQTRFAAARLLPNGEFDASFGNGGRATACATPWPFRLQTGSWESSAGRTRTRRLWTSRSAVRMQCA